MKHKFYIHQDITLIKYLHMRIIFLYQLFLKTNYYMYHMMDKQINSV